MNVYSAIGHRGGLHKTNSSFFVAQRIAASFLSPLCFALFSFSGIICLPRIGIPLRLSQNRASFSQFCVLRPYLSGIEKYSQGVWSISLNDRQNADRTSSTYSLVQVDGVLAGDNVGDSRALLLLGLDVGHFW